MSLQMKPECERCHAALPHESDRARICSYECTYCADCASAMAGRCPTCGGELQPRPRRIARAA